MKDFNATGDDADLAKGWTAAQSQELVSLEQALATAVRLEDADLERRLRAELDRLKGR